MDPAYGKKLAGTIFLQVDGGGENRLFPILGALLVARGLCETFIMTRLPVGHTHEDIDARYDASSSFLKFRPLHSSPLLSSLSFPLLPLLSSSPSPFLFPFSSLSSPLFSLSAFHQVRVAPLLFSPLLPPIPSSPFLPLLSSPSSSLLSSVSSSHFSLLASPPLTL